MPVYIRQLSISDKMLTLPDRPIGLLLLSIYSTPSTCHIYQEGLDRNLRNHHLKTSDADPFLYNKLGPSGLTTAGIMIDDVLVMEPTNALLDDLSHMLQTKCMVKYLSPRHEYLGWTIRRGPDGSIYPTQPALVANSLQHAGLTDKNPRTVSLPNTNFEPPPKANPRTVSLHNTNLDPPPDARPLDETEIITFSSLLGDMRYLADCTRP